jgi:hypothetical protein
MMSRVAADCGTDGVCSNIEQAGGVALCLPPACVFFDLSGTALTRPLFDYCQFE